MFIPQGHTRDDCEVPDKCFNCREEGHTSADCPEPVKCRNCFKEGHQMADCPDPIRCTRYTCENRGSIRIYSEITAGEITETF